MPSVLVTGAAHGIGLAAARLFAKNGYRVVALDVDGESLRSNCGSFAEMTILGDVRSDPRRIRDACGDLWPVDVLVNNVGVRDGRAFLDLPTHGFRQSLEVNVVAPFALTQMLARDLIEGRRGGSVVFVSSLHAHRVRMGPDYSASKAAAAMLVSELAAELAPHGIRVNRVSPGAIDTWSDRHVTSASDRARRDAMVPMRRLGEPEDVSEAILFLADDSRSAYITGADIKVDGGLDQYTWLHHLRASTASEALAPPADDE